MLYLGHFSFEQTERRRRLRAQASHGYFTCVAEADDIDGARVKLERMIRKLHKKTELFENVVRVDLEVCVEIRSVPRDGFLTFYNVMEGEDPGGISTAIRGATRREAVAFRAGPSDEHDLEDEHEVEPFIAFEPPRRRDRRLSNGPRLSSLRARP
jgi:hypothetical protein